VKDPVLERKGREVEGRRGRGVERKGREGKGP
jgi:hypothetical protein